MRTTIDQLYPDIWQQVFEYFNALELCFSLMHITKQADDVLFNINHRFCSRGLVLDTHVRILPEQLLLHRVISLELHQNNQLDNIQQCLELRSLKLIGHSEWIISILRKISQVNSSLEQLTLVVPGIGLLYNLFASIAPLLSLRRLEIYGDQLEERIINGTSFLKQTKIEYFILHSCSPMSWNDLSSMLPASTATDYEEQISATVATICADEILVSPLRLLWPNEFDELKHTIDTIAQQYLKQASKSVQHLIPLSSLGDGNCLFNSVVSLVPDSGVSAVELRVRTIIELVKNRTYYDNQFSHLVGPFNEAIRRTCNNYSFSELYEVVALDNALRCEVQSVYPYIDYRVEMKIMNAVYTPLDTSVSNNGRLIIFWTNSEDEVTTKCRPGSGGVWSPNHFVPLIRPCETPESPRKTTIKNNKVASIRSPEFSPPPNARKHRTSFSLIEESLSNLETNDARRKRQERSITNEQQREERLTADRLRKPNARENQSEDQRQLRLATDRLSKRIAKENESEDQKQKRLAANRLSKSTARENESENELRLRLSNQQKRSARKKLCRSA
ncbi:unnamed protein product [Adineta steineri]|uniref:Vertnin n=1 Tax=Adineta steineri TaxID=433720 RepID=A0A815WWA6_9BILA|nr:unnamed protein product [Adineta steineri]CAF1660288.1 unnamed protein product [Adineta steineri]